MAGEVEDAKLRPLAGFAVLPQHPALQLFCKEAAAGMGARMHGFSGAPCLVDGKAVGILRSTLVEDMVYGSSSDCRRPRRERQTGDTGAQCSLNGRPTDASRYCRGSRALLYADDSGLPLCCSRSVNRIWTGGGG